MRRTFAYARLLLIGISATTISAAVVGDPIPVFVPAVAGAVLVAGHHVYHRERIKDGVGDGSETTRVFSDDALSDGDRLGDRGDDSDSSIDEWMTDQRRPAADGGSR